MRQVIIVFIGVLLLAAPFATAQEPGKGKKKAQSEAAPPDGRPLEVFQDLEEVTLRIPRLAAQPHEKLVQDGIYQSETLIFRDTETGVEIWSLSRELCMDLANIERRSAWSCNGQYISFSGNKAFFDPIKNAWKKREADEKMFGGYHYVAQADGSRRRKLWGARNGEVVSLGDKFNNWDQKRANVLYYAQQDELWRLTLGQGERDKIGRAHV
jgi:hypothetical protein